MCCGRENVRIINSHFFKITNCIWNSLPSDVIIFLVVGIQFIDYKHKSLTRLLTTNTHAACNSFKKFILSFIV